MTLGDLVKSYRESHNISMDEFSKMCALSKGYISMLENNINPRSNKPIAPTLPTVKKIATAMNVDVDFILKIIDSDQEISLDSKSENLEPQTESSPKIMQHYNQLNDLGKHEAEKRVEELTFLPQYTALGIKAAHNDYIDEPDELEKMRDDLSNLKRPDAGR